MSADQTPGAPEDEAGTEVASVQADGDTVAEPATTEQPVVADPEPVAAPEPVIAEPALAPEPTPTVSAAEASWSRPAGSAAPPLSASPSGESLADRPEVLVGAAFAGGLIAAMILKRLGR